MLRLGEIKMLPAFENLNLEMIFYFSGFILTATIAILSLFAYRFIKEKNND